MSEVVQMFGRNPAPSVFPTRTSHVGAHEAMRRSDVRSAIARLLADHGGEGHRLVLADDAAGLRVDLVIGATRRTVAAPRPEADIDNLYRIVAAGVRGWGRVASRRASLRSVH